jgi:16S rRNA (guanine527-N7)-methyltransferase
MTDKNFKLEEEKKGKERITEEYFHTEMFHVKQSAVEQRFEEQLAAFGIRLSDMQKKQFLTYYKNLVLWNQVMNLTAITDMEEVYTKHFVDSLSFIKAISGQAMPEGSRLIDVGTGAGFPGLPLAIVYPGLQVTLMDSLNKRIRFLDDTVEQLGLANIRTVHARAEELARNKQHREQYDLCCSRAVANISTLSEYCLPFIKQGGLFISYKSEKAEEELKESGKAVTILGGKLEDKIRFILPGTDYQRILLLIRKIKATPGKYPRKAGTPSKEPLH